MRIVDLLSCSRGPCARYHASAARVVASKVFALPMQPSAEWPSGTVELRVRECGMVEWRNIDLLVAALRVQSELPPRSGTNELFELHTSGSRFVNPGDSSDSHTCSRHRNRG